MPWAAGSFSRTDGTRTGTTVWAQAKAALVKIVAADHDTHDQDLATGINQCVNKDGSNAFTGDADLGNNQLTNVGAGSAATDAATIGGTETLTSKTLTNPVIAQINDANGNEALILGATASAVNELSIINAATGNAPIVRTTGEADTGVQFQNSDSEETLILASVSTAVNELTITNAATGSGPKISATGGDTDVSPRIEPKGTGNVEIADGADTTKVLAIDAGSISTGTTRTLTMRDADTTIGLQLTAGTTLTKNPYALSSTTTQAHGLSGVPQFLDVRMTCLTGEGGYSTNDILDLSASSLMERGSTSGTGVTVQKDATNVALITGDTLPAIINKSTGAQFVITAANWKIDVIPYYMA